MIRIDKRRSADSIIAVPCRAVPCRAVPCRHGIKATRAVGRYGRSVSKWHKHDYLWKFYGQPEKPAKNRILIFFLIADRSTREKFGSQHGSMVDTI